MGCWLETDAITRMPIRGGDDVVMVVPEYVPDKYTELSKTFRARIVEGGDKMLDDGISFVVLGERLTGAWHDYTDLSDMVSKLLIEMWEEGKK